MAKSTFLILIWPLWSSKRLFKKANKSIMRVLSENKLRKTSFPNYTCDRHDY